MHERLFAHQKNLEPWSGHAEALGLDVEVFTACMEDDTHLTAIRADKAEAGKAGATGTPSFVLGLTDAADPGKVKGLTFIRGAQPFSAFQQQIDAALASLESN